MRNEAQANLQLGRTQYFFRFLFQVFSVHMHMHISERARVCVCVRACVRARVCATTNRQ